MTEYRDIPGYPGYRVGDDGTVLTCRVRRKNQMTSSWRPLKVIRAAGRYCVVGLTSESGKRTRHYVHVLVLTAFVGPRPDGTQARHFPDRDPTNNRLANLSWATPTVNNADKIIHGTHQIGTKNPRAKLAEADVALIRQRAGAGERPQDIAKDFSVSGTLIRLIAQRKCWKHIA